MITARAEGSLTAERDAAPPDRPTTYTAGKHLFNKFNFFSERRDRVLDTRRTGCSDGLDLLHGN